MRVKVCVHVCSSLGMQMYMDKGADGMILAKKFFPDVFSKGCSDIVAMMDLVLPSDIADILDAAPSWKDVARSIADALTEANNMIETHSPKQFEEQHRRYLIKTGSTKREFKGCGAPVFLPRNSSIFEQNSCFELSTNEQLGPK